MFAYIDESGNTGRNLFDADQPIFYSVAVISKADLDVTYASEFRRLAELLGATSLHAIELGAKLDSVLPDIQQMIKRDNVRFFVGKINKRDLVLTKLTDTLLDNHENAAVPWHVYNVQMLRLLNVFKLSAIVDESILMQFWNCLMETNSSAAEIQFTECLRRMTLNIDELPDARSRQIIGDAIRWAIAHPEAISVHSEKKDQVHHLPHLVVFPSILHAIQNQSKFWGLPVREIRHDRERMAGGALARWHSMLSSVPPTEFQWVDMIVPVGGAPGSTFKIVSSHESSGVQLADIVLWLLGREEKDRESGTIRAQFLKRVRRNAELYELSLNAMEGPLEARLTRLMSTQLPQSQIAEGKALLIDLEARRKKAIEDYASAASSSSPT